MSSIIIEAFFGINLGCVWDVLVVDGEFRG
jgi:hypothetical protein